MRVLLFFLMVVATSPTVVAQTGLPLQLMSLKSLSEFEDPGQNWILAETVYSNLSLTHDLVATPGTGILVNQPSDQFQKNLFTNWSHGDLELELEFMMPRGSNSGIYLQGRYEVQLFDSWKQTQVTFADAGGIYQRWDESKDQGFEGRPPRINASRAPGLWQSLRIVFDAPKFDTNGRKVQPARIVQVVLNGSIVQENVRISGPTRAAGFQEEAPVGPLMIQGDHGPVAFRNLRYRMTGSDAISMHDVTYAEYTNQPVDQAIWAPEGMPESIVAIPDLQAYVATSTDSIALRYEGNLQIPASGTYRFQTTLNWISGDPHWSGRLIGGALLRISDQHVLIHDRNQPTMYGDVSLNEGIHPFSFGYFKTVSWAMPQVSLSIEGPSIRPTLLLQPIQRPVAAERIPVQLETRPVALRGFIVHQGTKRTHTVAVGTPDGLHYSLDLSNASLLHAWRGPFADAAPMWHNRGHDQTILPLGSTLTFSGYSVVETGEKTPLEFTGYEFRPNPVFTYSLGEAVLEDHIQPNEDSSGLSRTLILNRASDKPVALCIAVSDQIEPLGDGRYAIDGFRWYVETDSSTSIRQTPRGQALMISLEGQGPNETSADYTIIW